MPVKKFDFNAEYSRVKWTPRTKVIDVPELAAIFGDEPPQITIRQLSVNEFAAAKSGTNRLENLRANAMAVLTVAGESAKSGAVGELIQMTADTEADVAFRLMLVVAGCVKPQIDITTAVKLGKYHAAILWGLSDEIIRLTDGGADVEKPVPSGK